MTPEEAARVKIDKWLNDAGWDVVGRSEYLPMYSQAVRESLMKGGKESDYLFFIDDKAIAVLEAKREENPLGADVATQAENYAATPLSWYKPWANGAIPLVYLSNGKKILFKNMLDPNSDYQEISKMHSPKDMLKKIGAYSKFGKLPRIPKTGLRDCQYNALSELERKLRLGQKRFLAVLATGSGKTYLACLAAYRQLAYANVNRVLFLVDRNNLGKQAVTAFSQFDKTESRKSLNALYSIKRLRKPADIDGTIVVSTIQKLYSYMVGENLVDIDEDKEDENLFLRDDKVGEPIDLPSDLRLPPDYFQFIVVDECHRSIYGDWQNVLKYFNKAIILGLTATPTPEAYTFFNNNIVENYTYEQSVIDGVNVPYDIYLAKTLVTEHGGSVDKWENYTVKTAADGSLESKAATARIDYKPTAVNRGITVPDQIDTILEHYRDCVYTSLYPERKEDWNYIPKTLIFAKNDNHASEIVKSCERVFGPKFATGHVPEGFVQKITYSSGDSDALIQQFRSSREFRIAVTVTLVSTGTDIKPLEVVMFMTDVRSSVLYEQMKGRGCRTITDSLFNDVTPNASSKSKFILFDAVGVTASDKRIKQRREPGKYKPTLAEVLEMLAHGYLTDENLLFLADYCSSINQRFENNAFIRYQLEEFAVDFNFRPKHIAEAIVKAFESGTLPYFDEGKSNIERHDLISKLIDNIPARNKLLEMQRGYEVKVQTGDELIAAGFDTEKVKSHIARFEAFVNDHKDEIEALRMIYNSEFSITMSMLQDLKSKLLGEDSTFTAPRLWSWYRMLDDEGVVGDAGTEADCLTNLIQLVRYAYKLTGSLVSLTKLANSRFNLYAGQEQNKLTDNQIELMRQISEYVAVSGQLETKDFYDINPDIWRQIMSLFKNASLADAEIKRMTGFILKVV